MLVFFTAVFSKVAAMLLISYYWQFEKVPSFPPAPAVIF
jgi:hypothetical protein